MKNWDAWKKPLCALLAMVCLLAAPMDGALAARDALVKVSSATMRAAADGSGRAVFKLGKGDRVTVTAVRGNVARVSYKGTNGYLPTSCLSLASPEAQEKLLRDAVVYKDNSASSQKLGSLDAGDKVQLLGSKGDWAKVQKGDKTGFILKSCFVAPEVVVSEGVSSAAKKTLTTTMNARVYASANTSASSKKVKSGTKMTVVGEKGGWYKVVKSGATGYMAKKAFEQAAPQATPAAQNPSNAAYKALKTGSSGASVLKLQKRLEALGYLDVVPNGKYASTTATAVKLFQAASDLNKSGVADSNTQAALYASAARKSGMLSTSIKPGNKGTNVQRLQMRLRSKGFFKDKVNGVYGASTQAAVKAYQQAANLAQDGAAGPATLRSLYSANAPKAGVKPAATPAPDKPTPTPAPKPTATPKPASTPKPAKSQPAQGSSKADKVISVAKAKLGKPYILGSAGPNSYDCSGLLMVAYGAVGFSFPHSACTIGYGIGKKVSRDELKRGDIVCFNTVSDGDLVDHVGIYLGGGSFLHASSGYGRVVISSLTGYYASAFSWGRSVL